MIGVPREEIMPGDVLALIDESLREPEIPRHLVIVTSTEPNLYLIHAAHNGVVEHRANKRFQDRIHSCWRVKS